MTESGDAPKKRRRWPWFALLVGLLLVGGPLAWRFRPLNATERTLLGVWQDGWWVCSYTDDRRFLRFDTSPNEIRFFQTGTWEAGPDHLTEKLDSSVPVAWNTALGHMWDFFGGYYLSPFELTFINPDEIELYFQPTGRRFLKRIRPSSR